MGDKKHIDRLFQESFKDFEATPSDGVWKNIENKLNEDKKERRVIPIWWRYAGVAALLLLSLTIRGIYFNNTEKYIPPKMVESEDGTTPKINLDKLKETKIAVENNNSVQNSLEYNKDRTENNPSENTSYNSKESTITNISSSSNKNASENNSDLISNKKAKETNILLNKKSNEAIASNSEEKNDSAILNSTKNNEETFQNKNSLIITEKDKKLINNSSTDNVAVLEVKKEKVSENLLSIEEAIDKTKDNIAEENNLNRWRIVPNAAPVYFNTLGKGSSIDPQFNSNSKTGEFNMSYGVNASYALNEKLKVRSGINKVNLSYNTNNVIVYQSVGISASKSLLQNVDTDAGSNAADNISLISGENLIANSGSFATSNTSINQALGYVEVPLEIEYVISNKKLSINAIGGFSSFFLSDNKIFSESESGTKTFLGEANNINKVSYSANFGFGFNYKASKKIDLNIEPMFKYQINTFNNTSGDLTPYFIGVYTGFAIKF